MNKMVISTLALAALATFTLGPAVAKDWSQMNKAERLAWADAYGRQMCQYGITVSASDKAQEDRIMSAMALQTLVAWEIRSRCKSAPDARTAAAPASKPQAQSSWDTMSLDQKASFVFDLAQACKVDFEIDGLANDTAAGVLAAFKAGIKQRNPTEAEARGFIARKCAEARAHLKERGQPKHFTLNDFK